MQKYRKDEWIFLNCNSPADLTAEYMENGVRLWEYDRCRDGHMLVSDFLIDETDVDFTTVIEDAEDGAGIGLYFGSGSYDDYLLAVICRNSISLRIPNGVPLGDTFRYEGAKRYYEIAKELVEAEFPLKVRFQKINQRINIWYEERKVLDCEALPLEKRENKIKHPRIMVKAVNTDKKSKAAVLVSDFILNRRMEESCCTGHCIWEESEEAAMVSLHLLAFRKQWTVTDERGFFEFKKLPKGRYTCVAGKEERGFSVFELIHDGTERQYVIPKSRKEKREAIRQGALDTDSEIIGLNGIWKFDWDKEEQGESEKWFCKDKHIYGKRIEVPFSWQSLQAFGEGFQADAYSLHQNNSFFTNYMEMGKTAWYQREIHMDACRNMTLVLGAVAGFVKVWLDEGQIEAGRDCENIEDMVNNISGNFYHPLRFPLGILNKGHRYLLTIKVTYPFHSNNCSNGKQGFWFTDAPGIWQNVWLEENRVVDIEDIMIDYSLDVSHKTANICGEIIFRQIFAPEERQHEKHLPDYAEIHINGQKIKAEPRQEGDKTLSAKFSLYMEDVHLWDTEDPYLYLLEVTLWQNGKITGKSSRKVGLRKIETLDGQILLNEKPLYIRGVLDQGYNPWGIYTYPFIYGERPGSMEYDIRKAKEYGYNLIRMHIKDNEPEWYSLCDELGMLVWDEHPSNFYGTWDNELWRKRYHQQLLLMIKKHNYHPGIVLFSVFNESWGITGGHEMSPWEELKAQNWQREETRFYKERNKKVLVIDNSGYAKTKETQLLDYHMYPDTFSDAKDFFLRMTKQNYAGSSFNCYNERNSKLMENIRIRELLQKNCSMDLGTLSYKGSEEQNGQPVIISEFVHTNQIEQLVRIMPGVSGYIRMNLASQENEDTSPMTNIRSERDFGYVHEDFSKAGYDVINSRNLIMADYPPLTRRNCGDELEIPVFVFLWEERLQNKELQLFVRWKGIDENGRDDILLGTYTNKIKGRCYYAFCPEVISFKIPENIKALYMFYSLYDKEQLICENSLQMEIKPDNKTKPVLASCNAANPVQWKTGAYHGIYEKDGRNLLWMKGKGCIIYRLPINVFEHNGWMFRIEVSTCECIRGTRLTDETVYPGTMSFRIGDLKKEIEIADSPWDRRALFSNSATMVTEEFEYKRSGEWGYGYHVTIPIPEEEMVKAVKKGYLEVRIECDEAGMVVYGNRMGRYGTDPLLIKFTE